MSGRTVGAVLLVLAVCTPGVYSNEVSRERLIRVMSTQIGYDPKVTTNGGRFQASVILDLVREAAEEDPHGEPLLIGYEDWFRAFLVSQKIEEAEAPLFMRLSYENRQDTEVKYRRNRVIREVRSGPEPITVANVVIWWPEAMNEKRKYSYDDTISTLHLKVTNHRMISYRLPDFGDQVVFDELKGVTGRPTTGMLGFLFTLIGEGRLIWSRLAISEDGLQIARARSKKGFMGVISTVTVQPDGWPDLAALEQTLKIPFEIKYQPLDLSGK